MNRNIQILLFLVVVGFTQSACKAGFSFYNDGDLISSKLQSSHSLSTMKSALVSSTYAARYPVKTYRIVYETQGANGRSVEASGLLAVPQKASYKRSPLLVYHHATITKNSNAPSFQHKATNILSKTASLGYIVIAPDYIGYGKSSKKVHPYLHANSLASASIDMIRASKEWLKDHKKKINNQLFLAGYSEGGYATMATHKTIERQHKNEFTITASAPAAGPYDLKTTVRTLLDEDNLASPASIGFVIKAYTEYYSSDLLNSAINAKYRNIVKNFISDGSYDLAEINDLLGKKTNRIIKTDFLYDIRDRTETVLNKSLRKNNIYDWKPKAPMRIIHGVDDKVVPYANAVTTVDEMIANGATDVELIDCDVSPFTAKHAICSVFAYNYTLKYFFGLADNL